MYQRKHSHLDTSKYDNVDDATQRSDPVHSESKQNINDRGLKWKAVGEARLAGCTHEFKIYSRVSSGISRQYSSTVKKNTHLLIDLDALIKFLDTYDAGNFKTNVDIGESSPRTRKLHVLTGLVEAQSALLKR